MDALKTYLSKLKTYDDLDMVDWLKKAENNEVEFAPHPDDDRMEANKKESMKGWFKTDRFIFDVKYVSNDSNVLNNAN